MNAITLPQMLRRVAREHPAIVAQYSKDAAGVFQPTSYALFYREVLACAAGLREAGIARGSHVGFISDNRKEWLIIDMGLLALGAVDVPRGCDSMAGELAYILSFGDCRTAVLENEAQLAKLLPARGRMPLLDTLILIDRDFDLAPYAGELGGLKVLSYGEIMEKGGALTSSGAGFIEAEIDKGAPDDLATIIFTSGTTGEPKGVMLSHRNFYHEAVYAPECIGNKPGETWLTILPVWHSFERMVQYIVLYSASALAYSKPIGKVLLADCQKIRPVWLTSVPRIWEALRGGVYRNAVSAGGLKKALFLFFVNAASFHEKMKNLLVGLTPWFTKRCRVCDILVSFAPFLLFLPLRFLGNVLVFRKIHAMLGGRLKAGVSGGGALPEAVDRFFCAAGVCVLEGYGLTEAAPVLAVRHFAHPVPQTIGPPFPDMEVVIRDPESGREMPPGEKGVLYARGEQIMLGYYKKPEETKKVIDSEGWLDSGDIGLKTWKGEIKLTGRAKDTIVLMGGENIEPLPIEAKIRDSEYVEHAVVLGQDQKFLAALIVPNFERLEAWAKENGAPYADMESLVRAPDVRALIHSEITEKVNRKTGFRGFEMIFRSCVLAKPFEMGVELSGKQDYKRHVIHEMYTKEITALFRGE
ncbi:MAG: AMP-binding protein [Spirochaetales bacterium]|jgi:long-chain acyl-CoA synthetase|nr:AMP-binding protein [Spirochaetales bacterium]